MARSRAASEYVCQTCAATFPKWEGQCRTCGAWNALVETLVSMLQKIETNPHSSAVQPNLAQLSCFGEGQDLQSIGLANVEQDGFRFH